MGKIRVQDLARMMGISNQDLVFKLKSIGVRVEGDDAAIDTDIIQAILQGKKLPHPREVILRDEPAPAEPARRRAAAPPPPARRPATNPLRPNRPRTLIQKVEPRIQTLPASERPILPSGFTEEELLQFQDADAAEAEMMAAALAAVSEQEGEQEAAAASEPQEVPAPSAVEAAAAPSPSSPGTAPAAAPPAPALREGQTARREPIQTPHGGDLHPSRRAPLPQDSGYIHPSRRGPLPPPLTPAEIQARRAQALGGGGDARRGGPLPQGSGDPARRGPAPQGGGADRRPQGTGDRAGDRRGPSMPQSPGDRRGAGMPQGTQDRRGPSMPQGGGDRRGPAPGRPPLGAGAGQSAPSGPSTEELKRRAEQRTQEQIERDKKSKKGKGTKKPGLRTAEDEDLTAYKGALSGLDEEEEADPESRRGRRAAQRKEEGKDEGGKLLSFKKAPPQGPVMIREGMTLREFAEKLGVKARDLMKALFDRGILANINHVLEPALAEQLAKDLGVDAMVVSFEEEVQLREEQEAAGKTITGDQPEVKGRVTRAPVVTIMGHVDHGKTSLLDAIRSSKITESEFGGITQHIGAYHVDVHGRQVVFLDTPGHEAFTMMRARGAKVTDIVVLVVGADDGVMPQTIEAINHARAAKVPIVVAINKIDKANANPDRVKRELSEQGLQPEDWGGDTVMVPLSALKREGINELLEMILLTADILDLKANPDISAQGAVLEARKEVGRGIVSTVLVQNGTLRVGDVFVSGAAWGRVRSMSDDLGRRAQEAGPSTPVEVTGFNDLPNAGDLLQVVSDEAQARGIAGFRAQETRQRDLTTAAPARMSLAQLFDRIQVGDVKELAVVVKADVQGSLEVLRDALSKLSTDKVKVQVLHAGVGAISTNDVLLASASKAIIVGFNVRPERSAVELAEKEEVEIRLHTVIYELLDELRKAMTGLLEPTFREVSTGRAEVRDTFKVPKVGTIAGCHVLDGVIPRTASVRLLRDNRVIFEGKIASLRRFKDDASEVRAGFDCGIGLERFQDLKPGDIIEAYQREEVAPVL
ncbi:MAG TPA: translation initiation factor IF-2 [Thermoanaerobaculia bacterium]|jgi:translation initiation factor IF-2|nr:translation initiation factor IF-2 [Thermoanaerobaculia bacterium]